MLLKRDWGYCDDIAMSAVVYASEMARPQYVWFRQGIGKSCTHATMVPLAASWFKFDALLH